MSKSNNAKEHAAKDGPRPTRWHASKKAAKQAASASHREAAAEKRK